MKGQRLTYYLILWLLLTVVYTATVLLYYKVPTNPGLTDSLVFTLILFGLGFSMFFAIRYMDVGIKSLPELIATHLGLAAIVTLVAIFLTRQAENFLLPDLSVLPETLVQGKVFVGILLYALIVMLFYFSAYRDRLDEKQKSEDNLMGLLHEAELSLLKSQLNPHFIFNSLNSISSLTITDPEKARDMVVKLSGFLRYSLGKGKEEFVLLEEEIDNANLFLDIEKTRFGDRLVITKKVDESIGGCKVPVLILQPLIENAVKYAMYDTTTSAEIELSAQEVDEHLIVRIRNPFDPDDRSSKGKGIGLANVRSRLQLLYGSRAALIVEKAGEAFSTTLRLPLQL